MEEGLAVEQAGDLLADTLGHLLDDGGVAEEGDRHPEALGGASFGGPAARWGPRNEVESLGMLIRSASQIT